MEQIEPAEQWSDPEHKGRPATLSRERLASQRDRTYSLLAEDRPRFDSVGRKIKTGSNVDDVFQVLRKADDGPLWYLQRKLSKRLAEQVKAARSSKNRGDVKMLIKQLRRLAKDCNKRIQELTNEYFELSDRKNRIGAVYKSPDLLNHSDIEAEFNNIKSRAEDQSQKIRNLQSELNDLYTAIAHCEVIDFVTSNRNTVNALKLANVLAGLPLLGWRRSFLLCSKLRPPEGVNKSDIYTILRRKLLPLEIATDVQEYLERWLRRSAASDPELNYLRQNWYYLKQAINVVAEKRLLRKEERAEAIAAEFQARVSQPSALDRLRATDEPIPLKKRKIKD